jgi:hypothetical protein
MIQILRVVSIAFGCVLFVSAATASPSGESWSFETGG